MIRFVDDKKLESDYLKACSFDKVFGTINAFMFKKRLSQDFEFFWNLYNDEGELSGNLSFVNDTFTICAKDDFCSEELAKFIEFWGNFDCISYNMCNVSSLDRYISPSCYLAFGNILSKPTALSSPVNYNEICKDIDLYSIYCLFKESFPKKFGKVSFESFNYDINYRIRRQQSFIYGIVKDDILASALEVMCSFDDNVVLGCLATNEKHRKKGLATSLLGHLDVDFPSSTVFVFAEDDLVTQFYKKLGFTNHAVWAQLTPARKD